MRLSLPAHIAAALIGLCAVLSAQPAFAHATLLSSEPADGTMIAASPPQLTLTFNEPVAALVLRLVGPDRRVQLLENPEGRNAILVIPTPAALAKGTYALSYRVISLDGHPVGATVVFSVGAASATPPSPEESHDPAVVVALWLAKLILYGGVFIGIGGSAFAAFVDWRRRATTIALLAAIAATAVAAGLQGADALGVPLASLSGAVVWRTGLATSFGATAAVLIGALLVALVGNAVSSKRAARACSLLALLGTGVAFALSGHASAAAPQALMRPAVLAHVLGVALWMGALLPLAVALCGQNGVTVLARFSRAIPWAVGALIVSGAVLAVVQVEHWSALVATTYGNILAAKLVLVLALLALAGWNRWRWTPAVMAGQPGARRGLRHVIVAELVIAALIFGLVAAWRFTPPPRALALAAARPALLHIHTAQAMADVRFVPGHAGVVDASVVIMTGDFGGLDAKEITLTIANRAAGVEAISRQATKGTDAIWRVERFPIPQDGRWTVSLDILVNDFEKIQLEGAIDIGREP